MEQEIRDLIGTANGGEYVREREVSTGHERSAYVRAAVPCWSEGSKLKAKKR
jgi:hypothetical protein